MMVFHVKQSNFLHLLTGDVLIGLMMSASLGIDMGGRIGVMTPRDRTTGAVDMMMRLGMLAEGGSDMAAADLGDSIRVDSWASFHSADLLALSLPLLPLLPGARL
jgi:hypothetical protein